MKTVTQSDTEHTQSDAEAEILLTLWIAASSL